MKSEQGNVRFFNSPTGEKAIEPIDLIPDSRWSVFFSDPGAWRAGLYLPEHAHPDEIIVLEKHTCPELFVCIGARAGLLLKQDGDERLIQLTPGQAVMVTDYHNGYTVDPGGSFLVIERTEFTTEYIDRLTGAFIRRVEVTPDPR